jgi:hypothetical protein
MTLLPQEALRFNLAIHNANVRILARFACATSGSFNDDRFIADLSRIDLFPFLTVREILQAVRAAGGKIEAKRVEITELRSLKKPALVYLNRDNDLPYSSYLLQLERADNDRVLLVDHQSKFFTLTPTEFAEAYVGIAYLHDKESIVGRQDDGAPAYDIVKLSGFMSISECRQLRDHCSSAGNYVLPSSKIAPSVRRGNAVQDPQSFGTALDLQEDHQGLVAHLIARSADVCGTVIDKMEGLNCKRLNAEDRIPPRFDNGVNLQRLKAVHCAFGESTVLEVTETQTGRRIDLHTGDAILVTCADHLARTRWRSEWSAIPRGGVAYLSSCWQRWSPTAQ